MRDAFPCPKAEGHRQSRGKAPFARECRKAIRNLPGFSDLSRPRKEVYRELVVGSASDPLVKRLGLLLGEIRSQWNWVPDLDFLNKSDFLLTWRLVRNTLPLRLGSQSKLTRHARLSPLRQWFRGNGFARLLQLCAGSPVTSESGRLTSVPGSSCCLTLVTSWTMLILCIKVRSMWCFLRS